VPQLGGPAAVMIGWPAVVLLALTGRRRTAAAVASIPLAPALAVLLTVVRQRTSAWSGGLPLFVWTAGRGPCRPGQPGRLLAGLLARPAAGPGHRGETASLPDGPRAFPQPSGSPRSVSW